MNVVLHFARRVFHFVDDAFKEQEHPRDPDGEFSSGGGGAAKSTPAGAGSTGSAREGHAEAKRDKSGNWSVGGKPASRAEQKRIASLAIPPAWTHVTVSTDPTAALQATGRDKAGTTQYRYSAKRVAKGTVQKFGRLKAVTEKAPALMSGFKKDATDKSLPVVKRESAAVMQLIAETGFRTGSNVQRGAVPTYGASSLLSKHVKIKGDQVAFDFIGKHGIRQQHVFKNAELAAMLKPRVSRGGRLFDASNVSVRRYFHSKAGATFKVKDLRTYTGTAEALRVIKSMPAPTTIIEFKKAQKTVATAAAARLGNTPAIALSAYIDPGVWSAWQSKLE